MIVYLAHPIDRAQPGSASRIQGLVAMIVSRNPDVGFYVPSRAFSGGLGPNARKVVEINEAVLKRSDLLLILYLPMVETWGVPQEVRMAEQEGIPIFVLCPDGPIPFSALPLNLQAFLLPDRVFDSVESLSAEMTR